MNHAAKNQPSIKRLFTSPRPSILLALSLITSSLFAQELTSTHQLIGKLGCAGCHTQLPYKHDLNQKIPDLSQAGARYTEGYLFSYLQNPTKVRRHLGDSRMPNFQLNEQEALALTRYLTTQQKMPELPQIPELGQPVPRSLQIRSDKAFADYMANQALCLTCHGFNDRPANLAVTMDNMGARLKPNWMRSFLSAPDQFGISSELMPAQFFQPTKKQNVRTPMGKSPAQRINRIVDFLVTSSKALRRQQLDNLTAAVKKYPKANAALGKQIFVGLNCAGCHLAELPPAENSAPNLSLTGSRVKQEWLKHYLEKPTALRRAGYRPGSGGRMPDFKLSNEEVQQLTTYLMQQTIDLPKAIYITKAAPYQQSRARKLLSDKLPCLGCHQLDGNGGVIGPDLSIAGRRLNPDYIDAIIANPKLFTSHQIMPEISMSKKVRSWLTSLLVQQRDSTLSVAYLPFTQLEASQPGQSKAARQYAQFCASCHGPTGNADGFNSVYLPVKPTAHADSGYMSTRTDGVLYDGIYSGGYILNKHQFMPPWRSTFSDVEIRDLVQYMRELCDCPEPDWADKKAGARK
ncbi:MAG: c-type cytochrome [Calditrichia bacterium]